MFGLPTDLSVPKRQTLAFYYSKFSKKKNTGAGERLPQKMIISVSIIYGKSFRLLSLEIEELANDQVGQENPHYALLPL